MRSFLVAFFGIGFNLFAEGFSRIIISFFHKESFVFFGIGSLPGTSWIVIIYFVSTITTWLGAMLAQSIASEKSSKAFRIFLILQILWILFEIIVTYQVVPVWYLISFPLCSLVGIYLSKITYQLNTNAISDTVS